MAYVPRWEQLSEALTRVEAAAGLSTDEARIDICRAIADGAVKFRGTLRRHTTRPVSPPKKVVQGNDFLIPAKIRPEDLDWEESRPLKPWAVRREISRLPGLWEVEWIELFDADVTKVLCTGGKRGGPAQHAASGAGSTSRSRPGFERARRAIEELYPEGVPGQAVEPNVNLCRRVGEKLKKQGLPDVSNDTILRAAGRRRK
jgi:hypothetical protein